MKRKLFSFIIGLGLFFSLSSAAHATVISLKNNSNYSTIYAAVIVFVDGDGWITDGWYEFAKGEVGELPYDVQNSSIYVYAYTYDNAGRLIEWKGDTNNQKDIRKAIIEDVFTARDTEIPKGEGQRDAVFVKIDLKKPGEESTYDEYTYSFN